MKKIIHITKYLLPLIFIVFYFETTMFMHSHVIDNEVVFHSHPYSPSQGQHTHNSAEMMTFAQMSIMASGTIFIFTALSTVMVSRAATIISKASFNSLKGAILPQLRAPPIA